jgi:GNAT superfamily N-acetyltransferase
MKPCVEIVIKQTFWEIPPFFKKIDASKKRCLNAYAFQYNIILWIFRMPTIHLRPLRGHALPFRTQLFKASFTNQTPVNCRLVLTAAQSTRLAPIHITFTTNYREIDVIELANLLSRCATFSPGHATNADDSHLTPLFDASCNFSDIELEKEEHALRFQRRLRRALKNSLVTIAAYVPETSLPKHLHRSARDLSPPNIKNNKNRIMGFQRFFSSFFLPFLPGPGPKVLVGFARAVGDAALVATVHDIAVLPEMRGKGLGKILVEKLTDQVRR